MKEIVPTIGPQLKNYFISENRNLTELEIKETSLADLHEISGDDEVWLVQCPRSMDVSELLNNKIKLPGKTTIKNVETIAVEYQTPKTLTFGCKSKKKYSLKNLNFDGSIVIREKLQTVKKEKDFHFPKPERVPFPGNLKERHPLLGFNFGESIELPEKVLAKLKEARAANLQVAKESKTMETIKIEETDDEVVFVKSEKLKSKKRKNSAGGNDSHVKKKKSKKISEDPDDFQWIKDI